MDHILCIARSSDLQYYVTHHAGVPFVTCHKSDRVDQIVVSNIGGFGELLIKDDMGWISHCEIQQTMKKL